MHNVNGYVRKVVLWQLAIILLTACNSADATPTPTPSPVGCNFESQVFNPSSPDTDCLVWEKLYQLAYLIANQHITGPALVTLESEIYPAYAQAYLNCGEPLSTFADYVFYLTVQTREGHGFDPFLLMAYIVGAASTVEFAELASSLGCDAALILAAESYTE